MTYAPFGQFVYGENVFGAPTTISITTVITVTPLNYDSLQINWTPPGGTWNHLILMRSSFGTPLSVFDNYGTVLLDEDGSQGYSVQYLDSGLQSGHFYYYALFVETLEQATPVEEEFLLAGAGQGLVLTDWGFGDTFATWVPDFYLELDEGLATSSQPDGPLVRFLDLIGYEMDWIRSEIESLFLLTNVEQISGALLPELGANYGVAYEPELGMARSRVLVQNAVYLYKNKGTLNGVESAASAFSGYGCSANIGKNLEIQLDDSAFDQSVGHWKPLNAQSTITTANASTYFVTPPHTEYDPMPVDSISGIEGYLPESNERIAVIGANGAVLGLSTCTPASAVNLGIPIPQESPPTYVVSAYFYPTSATLRSFFMKIDWYALNGSFISSTTGSSVAEVGGEWVQASVVGIPPAGAYWFGRTVHSSATLSTDLHLMDAEQVEVNVLATPGPTTWEPPRDIQISLYPIRRQLITNPTGKGGTTGWDTLFNVGTIAVSEADIAWPEGTTQGFVVTAGAADVNALTSCVVQPGLTYTVSCWVMPGSAPVGGFIGNAAIPAYIPFSPGTVFVDKDVGAPPNVWNISIFWWTAHFASLVKVSTSNTFYEVEGAFVQGSLSNVIAPAEAVIAQVWISVDYTEIGSQHYIGAPLLAPESSVLPYFDATFSPSIDYLFEGTPNNSISDYYPNLPAKLSRLANVLPEYIPIGSTFSLLVGEDIAQPPSPPAPPVGAFYDWDDASDTWDNASDTWG
jgi:hypothetical protein